MNILKFSSQFSDENAYIVHFKAQRDVSGVVCPKCRGTEFIIGSNASCATNASIAIIVNRYVQVL